jgi:hypothetical protein
MNVKATVRFINEIRRVNAAYNRGLQKALDRSGTITRRSAQRQFSRRKPKKKPTFTPVGTIEGVPLVSASFRQPIPGKVTTWRTTRNPGGYLRSAIFYAKDMRRESVVIGPSDKAVTVNQLQEFGGSAPRQLKLVSPTPVSEFAGVRFDSPRYVGQWLNVGSRKRGRVRRRTQVQVPAGRYMGKGLQKVVGQIPQQFRGLVQGP